MTQPDLSSYFSGSTKTPAAAFLPLPLGWYNADVLAEMKANDQCAIGELNLTFMNLTDAETGEAERQGVRLGGRRLWERIKIGYNPVVPDFPKDISKVDLDKIVGDIQYKAEMVNSIAKQRLWELAWAVGAATREKVDHEWVITLAPEYEGDVYRLVNEISGKRIGFRISKHRTYKGRDGSDKVQEQIGGFRPA